MESHNSQLSDELISIAADIREHLSCLHELGIETVDPAQPSETLNESTVADAEVRNEKLPPWRTLNAPLPTFASAPAPVPRSGTSPAKTPQTAANTLFGDLTAKSQKLERSTETFEEIWADIGECTRCPLHQARTHIVHTEGNRRARLMFIGEAPGADEDAQARPFVGRAGQLLTKIIEAIGLKREEVLIGNVNRCRPPGNRPPTEEEATMCKPFLLREIAAVQPEVIVVMGNTATRNLLNAKLGITKLRGQFQDYHGVKVMPTFHPAYLLRDPSKKQETWQDLKKVRDYLETTAKGNS
ncbi:MAG TPA: uracil-DNA glycosylase [Pyrinomonadaceae bacterium]|jgi:DNA polymerase|nr:uracil-DNA glycosylase [Pyrinomonadaceae bacterium]